MKLGNVSFGAKIDVNTMKFLVNARKQELETKEMETLMKQVSPQGEIETAFDKNGELLFMKKGGTGVWAQILPVKHKYYDIINSEVPYETNQATIDLITKRLKEIKNEEGNTDNTPINTREIWVRDHNAELKEIFGEPVRSTFDDAIIERDY